MYVRSQADTKCLINNSFILIVITITKRIPHSTPHSRIPGLDAP